MTRVETAPEAGDVLETVPEAVALNHGMVQAIEALAANSDKLAAAHDKIRTLILTRAFPGDFVRFGDKVELGGPGAERIRAFVGISLTGWKDSKDSWTDKHGDAYTWWYKADARLGTQVIEGVEGRASSRDKFFGFENGAWKELQDVKEADIRTAARRCVIKEAVKLMLGIRGLPNDPAFLKSIGLDPAKIKAVEFAGRGEKKVPAAPAGTAVVLDRTEAFHGKFKSGAKKDKSYTKLYAYSGDVKYGFFIECDGKPENVELTKKVMEAKDKKAQVVPVFTADNFGNTLTDLKPAPEQPKDPSDDEPHA